MKKKAFSFASRMSVIVLACMFAVVLVSCESDTPEISTDGTPEEEGSIDDVLSIGITPMSFSTEEKGTYYLFDYTPGGQFIGAYTFVAKGYGAEFAVDLRRGRHKLLWIKGIYGWVNDEGIYSWYPYDPHGIHYDAGKKELVWNDDEVSYTDGVVCCELNITVTDHRKPTMPLTFLPVTGCMHVLSTDLSQSVDLPKGEEARKIGTINIGKRVKTMSLMGKGYTLAENGGSVPVFVNKYRTVYSYSDMLCPLGGLDDVQASCDIKDEYGQTIPTTLLPKFSIRRGYTTHLEGPLFSGNTSDWKIEAHPH